MSVTLSVVTPSFNMLDYLQRCEASVADQAGRFSYEHIVADGGSQDGTVDWLRERPHIRSIVGPDQGMYDAINKGLRAAQGQIVAYLSCDEQYLPGTFAAVTDYFARHPEVDVVFGDTLVTRPDGSLICFRKAYTPLWPCIAIADLYNFPSSMFLRRRVVSDGNFFDPQFKDVGDAEFVIRLQRRGYHMAVLRRYLSAFTLTGSNRSQDPKVAAEHERLVAMLPGWVGRWRRPLNLARLAVKIAGGAYFERAPLRYALYPSTLSAIACERTTFESQAPSPRWRVETPEASKEPLHGRV